MRSVLPWSSRHAVVPGSLTLSHFVHPGAAVEAVSSAHKTCGGVDPSNDAEPCKEQKVQREVQYPKNVCSKNLVKDDVISC